MWKINEDAAMIPLCDSRLACQVAPCERRGPELISILMRDASDDLTSMST